MGQVQLRGQVVQADDRPIAAAGGKVARLAQDAGQRCQLFLAAGQRLPARQAGELDAPVRPVRTEAGVALGDVPLPAEQQRVGQAEFRRASSPGESPGLPAPTRPGRPAPARPRRAPVAPGSLAAAGSALRPPPPTPGPTAPACRRRGPVLEQGVALLEGAGVATPLRQEIRFHVEQAPVEVAPAVLRAPGDQVVAAGFEGDHGNLRAQLGQAGCARRRPGAPPSGCRRGAGRPGGPAGPVEPFGIDLQVRALRSGSARRRPGRGTSGRSPAGARPRRCWTCRRRSARRSGSGPGPGPAARRPGSAVGGSGAWSGPSNGPLPRAAPLPARMQTRPGDAGPRWVGKADGSRWVTGAAASPHGGCVHGWLRGSGPRVAVAQVDDDVFLAQRGQARPAGR